MSDEVDELPSAIGNPARRALTRAGITRLDQLTEVSEADLYRLHGVGAKAIGQLRVALAARGQGLADDPSPWASNKRIEPTPPG